MNNRTRRCLVVDSCVCTGCRTCETVCSLIKTAKIFPDMARLRIDRDPFEGRSIPHVCHQCTNPQCMNACPAEAIKISEKSATVFIEKGKCNGCALCREACPYGMIRFDKEQKKAFKCDLCGGYPQCLETCPMKAISIAVFEGTDQP